MTSGRLAELARRDLTEYYGLGMHIDVGNDFWNALIYGTLKSLVERTDSSGFCQTSYGEENGVKCYGETHYPRDTAEAARVLAAWGLVDLALRILDFTLRNKPADQYYIPHVYRPDGSVKANTVQVDTPAHVVRALARCIELAGPEERSTDMFRQLDAILDGTWERHFHPEWQLLDAGNYNEQIEGDGLICDLFTNCSLVSALEAMIAMARVFDRRSLIDKYETRREQLVRGIEGALHDTQRDIYRVKVDLPSGRGCDQVNWVNLYCQRWYSGNTSAWDNILDVLRQETTICWDGMDVISGSSTREGVLGKFFGHLLAYLAQTGRFALLDRHLLFAEKTIKRPGNLYPEWWYYQDPEKLSEYQVGFWKIYSGIWKPYSTDPEGDYTMDSGNCEQCAAFLSHFTEDLLGVTVTDDGLDLCPRLPFRFSRVIVRNSPTRRIGDKPAHIGYELRRGTGRLEMTVSLEEDLPIRLAIPVGPDISRPTVELDGSPCVSYNLREQRDVTWLTIDSLPNKATTLVVKTN